MFRFISVLVLFVLVGVSGACNSSPKWQELDKYMSREFSYEINQLMKKGLPANDHLVWEVEFATSPDPACATMQHITFRVERQEYDKKCGIGRANGTAKNIEEARKLINERHEFFLANARRAENDQLAAQVTKK